MLPLALNRLLFSLNDALTTLTKQNAGASSISEHLLWV